MKPSYHTFTKLVYSCLGVVAFLGGVGIGAAEAVETTKLTRYPGTMCQSYDPASNDVRYNSEGVFNVSSTKSASVTCPIPSTVTNARLSYVIVEVREQSDAHTIRCTAVVRGDNGEVVTTKSGHSDEYFGGNADVYIPDIKYQIEEGWTYNVTCGLPRKALDVPTFGVVSYTAYEETY